MILRLHHFLSHSRANGPGVRAGVWVQGCSLGCPGCFNPETHAPNGGEIVEVDELFERIVALGDSIEGLTISGGEPLQQREAVTELLRRIKAKTRLSIVLFTGFMWREILRMGEFLNHVDVLIAGRYDQEQRLARGLRGSTNKTVHLLTNRYAASDLESVPIAEVVVTLQGELLFSGIEPVNW